MSLKPRSARNTPTSESSLKAGKPTRRQPLSLHALGFNPHPGQAAFLNASERFRILVAGARFGKDTVTLAEMLRLVTTAAAEPDRPATLVPKVHAWCVGPSFPLLTEPWRVLQRMIPPSMIVTTNQTRMSIELIGDILIELKSAERPETLVGSGLDVLCLLEAGLIPEEAWTTSLRPRLASYGRWGLLIASGTPKGSGGFFHRLFTAGQNPDQGDTWSAQFATWDSPLIDPAEIESMRDTMTSRAFAQEVAGAFVTDDGAVFRGVRDCIVPAREARGPITIGIDWGTRKDATALAALDSTGHLVAFDAFKRLPWSQIISRTASFIEATRAQLVVPESNGIGDPLIESLETELADRAVRIEPFVMTNASKRQVIDRLSLAIEKRSISWPDNPALTNELELFEYSTSAAGNLRFSAPAGQHDDRVVALALAVSGAMLYATDASSPSGGYVDAVGYGDDGGRSYENLGNFWVERSSY